MSVEREAVRSGLLRDALGGPIDLNAVDWHVKHQNPSASPAQVQYETLAAIRECRTLCYRASRARGAMSETRKLAAILERDYSRSLPEAGTDPCLATLAGGRQCHSALHTGSPSARSRAQPLLHIVRAHPTGRQKNPRQDRP